jgi:hypothetical protein
VNFHSSDLHGFDGFTRILIIQIEEQRPEFFVNSSFVPLFPPVSTRKSRRPQFSHSEAAVFHCRTKRNARKFIHCKREGCAASDRARLVLRR